MKLNRLAPLGLVVSLVAASGLAAWAADPPAPQKVTTVAGITEYHLGNGLRVLLFPDESKPTVTVNITYLVGSRHEGYGESGMAHLLEHLMFKGTPDHPQVWKELQEHGARFNGSTSYDRTNYFETLPASPENLEFALKLEADRMVNSFIAQKDLDSEMTVVRNEFEMGENNPMRILSERIMSTAYLWHNYGKSTIGSREDIERAPIDRLQAFYRKYYQPDNAVLIVVGKFDEPKTLAQINDIYGRSPRPERKLDPTYTVEPAQDGEREVILRRAGDTQAIGVVYHICAAAHEDMAPLQVLASILSADQTGRLYKALIDTKLATDVGADAQSMCEPGVLEVMVEARQDQTLDEIRAKLFEVLDGLGQQKFTTEEVERAKKIFARNFALMMNDSARLGMRLSGSVADGDWRLMFLQRDRLAAVTPEDVQRVAAKYLKPTNRTVGEFIPTKDADRTIVPPTPDTAALLKDYKDTQEVAQGEAFEATYENIEARTQRTALPAGMKLAMLPKENRGDRVNGVLVFHYGSEADLSGKETAADFLAPMLMRGTTEHTRRQIQDRLAELNAQVRVSDGGSTGGRYVRLARGGPGTLDVSIETTRENLPAVLDLVAEILRHPAFPAEEFETLQRETLAGIEQQMSEPMALASNELQRRLSPYPPSDIRYVPTMPERVERVKAVNLDQVKSIYTGLVGGSYSQAGFVGDFDPNKLQEQLGKLFTDWTSPKPYERIDSKYQPASPDTIVIATPDKTNAMVTLGLPLEIRDDDPDYPALTIGNVVLGANSNSRLMNRIRQKEGLAYGCGSMATASPLDRLGAFLAYSICAPQNAERTVACTEEEISRLVKDGIPQKELDEVRSGYRQQLGVMLANDRTVAAMLARDLYLSRTTEFAIAQLAKIDALTPEAVQKVMAKYIRPDQLIVIRAGDFDKAASPISPEQGATVSPEQGAK
jgi:zinc protease